MGSLDSILKICRAHTHTHTHKQKHIPWQNLKKGKNKPDDERKAMEGALYEGRTESQEQQFFVK